MEIPSHLFREPISCNCGSTHLVPLEEVVVAESAQKPVLEFLHRKQYRKILLVADANTNDAFGKTLFIHLKNHGIDVQSFVFSERHGLLPDEGAVQTVTRQIQLDAYHTVLAVGSGVINDIVRYTTFHAGMPYISVATAPSMDGYASNMAAMQFSGMKVTSTAHTPQAIFADLSVLVTAPFHLLQSGFGDLIGKVISLSDWMLANTLYGEHVCEQSYELVFEPLSYIIENADKLARRDEGAVKNLFIGLINSGIAMAMMGNSRPCSGSEHHCSHFWDLAAYQGKRQHVSHGIQVGHATYWMIQFYHYIEQLDSIRSPQRQIVTEEFKEYAREFYDQGAAEVIRAQTDKSEWLRQNDFRGSQVEFGSLKTALNPTLKKLNEVKRALLTMGIPADPEVLGLNKTLLMETFLHAKELRSRYTVFDFLEGQGILSRAIAEMIK